METLLLDEMSKDQPRFKARRALDEILMRPVDEEEAKAYDEDLFSFSEEAQAAQAAANEAFGDVTYMPEDVI